MIFLDFEVTKYDWLAVFMAADDHTTYVMHNDEEMLRWFYNEHKGEIWVGYNIRHYDQWIFKAILYGLDSKELSDWIIVKKRQPYLFSSILGKRDYEINFFDVMPNPPVGLKTMEGFMGSDIRETDIPFDIDRPLTKDELQAMEDYCRHDVEETIRVFVKRKEQFEAQMGMVTAFGLGLRSIGDTEAQITAKVLNCHKRQYDDEFKWYFLPCLRLKKYRRALEWFAEIRRGADESIYKSKSLKMDVAGVPHVFGFGGLHGAPDHPIHRKGLLLHVDVGSYYPSMLIAWDLVTRSAWEPEQYRHVYDTRMELKAAGKKKEQAPYKKLLNALSGAMKDKYNPAYDPRNNNIMCINGQLMLLDLIEHLEEQVEGFELIQSNTDGLIIMIPDTDKAFDQVDRVCADWEYRCSTSKCQILLGLDIISEIYQGDVNNYLWIEPDGKIERKGAYVKELSSIDYDLPIINEALVKYMVDKVPVEDTVMGCDELIRFQKLVKLSDAYEYVMHNGKKYTYKSYRVFASNDLYDGRIFKCREKSNPAKFGNTPDHCFIDNGSMDGQTVPERLDKWWYINLAKDRLEKKFGVIDGFQMA